MGERVAEALTEIAEAAADGATVVVTTHGLAGRAGMCRLLGLPFEHWRAFGSLENCAWAVLHRHHAGGYWRVAEYDVVGRPYGRRFRDPAGRLVVFWGSRGRVQAPAPSTREGLWRSW